MKRSINQSTMIFVLNTLSILFIAAAILSSWNVMGINAQVAQSNTDRFDLTFHANRFMNASDYLTNEVRAYAVTGKQIHYDNYMNEAETLQNTTVSVDNMKEIGITPEEETKLEAMLALSDNLIPLETAAMEKTAQGMREEAIQDVYGESYDGVVGQIGTIKEEFLTMLDTRAENTVNNLIAKAGQTQTLTFLFIIAVAALQLVNAAVIMLRTIIPVKKLQKEMEEIAKGNLSSDFNMTADSSEIGRLTHAIIATKTELKKYIGDISQKLGHIADGDLNLRVDIEYIGDFAPIKSALITILGSLNTTLSQISASSQQLATGSGQIAGAAQSLAHGSTEQAATVQQFSASIHDISEKTGANAELANKSARLAETIMQNAELGSRQMNEMMTAVNEINNASQNIGKVIKAIDDIAFQTNILALNAAVEAARAGQHGKGFAVVADEVRRLAAKSAEAAKETDGLIASSIEKAQFGAKIAAETAASLHEIVEGINESTKVSEEIARSSQDQSSGISQINEGIEQVAKVVQINSATSEESASAAEELSGQSALLKELVGHFRLRDETVGQSAAQLCQVHDM